MASMPGPYHVRPIDYKVNNAIKRARRNAKGDIWGLVPAADRVDGDAALGMDDDRVQLN